MSPRPRPYAVPCLPPVWARGGHAQTLLGHLLPSPGPRIDAQSTSRELRIELADGDRLVAYELAGTSGVRVHLLHGLSGDVNSEYLRRTARVLQAEGHEVWAVNHRGCGSGRGLAAQPYHSGRTEDLQAILRQSVGEAPNRVHLVVGFSLGGNLALLHAARGLEPQPVGIVAVNPPADLERAALDIGRGWSRIYERRFMWRLRRDIRARERLGLLKGRYRIPLSMSMRELDDVVTAPECGFVDGRDYYARCSSAPRLRAIETPAVIVTARDDPFVDSRTLEEAPRSEHVHLHLEETGGHVGYLARRGWGWSRWLDGALVHYVNELVGLARV